LKYASIKYFFKFRTWSTGRNIGDRWPDDPSVDPTDIKDWPTTHQSPAFTDLVPEFEPGKPWKVCDLFLVFIKYFL
jgi:hypothetical protein